MAITEKQKSEIIEMRVQGLSYAKIASAMKMGRQTIQKICSADEDAINGLKGGDRSKRLAHLEKLQEARAEALLFLEAELRGELTNYIQEQVERAKAYRMPSMSSSPLRNGAADLLKYYMAVLREMGKGATSIPSREIKELINQIREASAPQPVASTINTLEK